jgi:hypothetical protein
MVPKSNRNQIVKTGYNNSTGARDFPKVNKMYPRDTISTPLVEIAILRVWGHPVVNAKDGTWQDSRPSMAMELYHQNPT